MVNVSVARRYARALIEVAAESSRLEPVGEQLASLAKAIHDSPELAAMLQDPSYTHDQRLGVMLQVMQAAQVTDPNVVNLVKLLVDRYRTASIPDIDRAYRLFADARAGRIRGQLISARPLDGDSVKRVERALEQITQRAVVLESHVDASVLGGVATQVGSVIYDGTLRSQLNELKRKLA